MPLFRCTVWTLNALTVGKTTWCANKWEPASQKSRSVKMAQWANKGTHCRWTKEQVGKITHDIATRNAFTRDERKVVQAALGVPAFRDALE